MPAARHTTAPRQSAATRCAIAPTSQARWQLSAADRPLVGVVIGSESDRERIQPALDELASLGIPHELEVRSAHRDPDAVAEYAKEAQARGLAVLIAGAGMAAA